MSQVAQGPGEDECQYPGGDPHVWVYHCGGSLPSVATCMSCGRPNRRDVQAQILAATPRLLRRFVR